MASVAWLYVCKCSWRPITAIDYVNWEGCHKGGVAPQNGTAHTDQYWGSTNGTGNRVWHTLRLTLNTFDKGGAVPQNGTAHSDLYLGSNRISHRVQHMHRLKDGIIPVLTRLIQYTTRTTRTAAFWWYPPPPHYWVTLDPKSKEDKVKVTNLKKCPKFQCFKFWNKHYTRHTFWSGLIRCTNMKRIRQLLLKIQSGHDSVHRRTDGQGETSIPPFQLRWSKGYNNLPCPRPVKIGFVL